MATLQELLIGKMMDAVNEGAKSGSAAVSALQGKQADQANKKQGLLDSLRASAQMHGINPDANEAQQKMESEAGPGPGGTPVAPWQKQLGDQIAKSGESFHAGDATITSGADPYAKMLMGNKKGEESAYQAANKFYNTNSSKLNDVINPVENGINALTINGPGSIGQLRTAMVAASGFKRYNDSEGIKSLPDSVKSQVMTGLAKLGVPVEGDGVLNDQQRKAAAQFFNGKIGELGDQHNQIKSQALNSYGQSSFANQEHLNNLQNTMGGPMGQRLEAIKAKMKGLGDAALPGTNLSPPPNQTPGVMDQVKNVGASILDMLKPSSPVKAAGGAPPPGLTKEQFKAWKAQQR